MKNNLYSLTPPPSEPQKCNVFTPSVLVPLISPQVCLTAATSRVIFSPVSSSEPPVSPAPYTSAQVLNEGVCSGQMWPFCVCVCDGLCEEGFLLFLSFPINVAFFFILQNLPQTLPCMAAHAVSRIPTLLFSTCSSLHVLTGDMKITFNAL